MTPEISEVKDNYDLAKSAFGSLYDECREDWNFLHGLGQWQDADIKLRKRQGRPSLVLNQLLPYANQVVNDIRQARLAIRVTPVDEFADIDTAEVLQGIIRNIEKQSKHLTVYATAALNAVGAGIGWIVVKTDYAHETSFDQELYIDRILDFESVYIDPNSVEIDGSDAEFAFVLREYTEDRFKELWPDAECASFEETYNEDTIQVVEYYYKYYEQDTIYRIILADGTERIINKEQKGLLDDDGTVDYELMDERPTEYGFVKKCVFAGGDEPLEETEIPCKYIPIVPVIGSEVWLDGKREFHSLIRQAKDGQRMYNYWKSASTEMIALQPKAPWIAPVGSFDSFADEWARANNENFSTLEYDIVLDKNGQRAEPPQRQMPIQGSPAMMQEANMAREDIRLAIGMPNANMGEKGNEVSGVAVRQRQIEGDNATFHFVDNLAASLTQVGRILVEMIPRLYSAKKIIRILGEDGTEKRVPINQPFEKAEDGNLQPAQGTNYDGIYDLMAGKYDVECDIGASYSSKRQETADKLIQLINAKPEIADVTADLLFEALDLPKAKDISKRLRAMMPPEITGDDPQSEKLKMAGEAIAQLEDKLKSYEAALQDKRKNADFEQNVKLKELDIESQKMAMDAQKAAADIQKTMAEIEKMRAETTGFSMETVQALGGAVNGIAAQVEDITQAMNIIFDAKEQEGSVTETSEPFENSDEMLMESETND